MVYLIIYYTCLISIEQNYKQFSSRVNNFSTDLNLKAVDGLKEVDLQILKDNKLINKKIKKVKIYGNYKLSKPIKISGISLSKGAEKSVIDAGGVVEN